MYGLALNKAHSRINLFLQYSKPSFYQKQLIKREFKSSIRRNILLIAESCSWMLLLEFEIVCANVKINSCSVVRYTHYTVSGFQYHFPYLTRTTILMIIIWVKSDDRFIVVWPQHARRHIFQTGAAQYGPIWPQICS